jgi:hypothetical protein
MRSMRGGNHGLGSTPTMVSRRLLLPGHPSEARADAGTQKPSDGHRVSDSECGPGNSEFRASEAPKFVKLTESVTESALSRRDSVNTAQSLCDSLGYYITSAL